MNRRELLGGVFALSAGGFLSGCRKEASDNNVDQGQSRNPATLRVILQGPFAVVLNKDERYKVTAVVPNDPIHQFRFQTPMSVEKSNGQYRFALGPEGLDIGGRRPYIDHGLDDMTFDLGPVGDLFKDAFVGIDLPAPDIITFIPPPETVVFADGRVASAPLNHVLQYKITDLSKVVLHSKQLGDKAPLPFSEVYKQYQEHGSKENDYKGKKGHGPQFPKTRDELGRPSESDVFTLFLGVGVAPETSTEMAAVQHALDFFNTKLVPLFPKSPTLKKLSEIRNYGAPCTPAAPRVNPTVLNDSVEQPKLLLVTSSEDCRAAGILGITP